MRNTTFVQFLRTNFKRSKFWILGAISLFVSRLTIYDSDVLSKVFYVAIGGIVGIIVFIVTIAFFYRFDKFGLEEKQEKKLWNQPRFWVYVTCCMFGIMGGAIFASTNAELNIFYRIIYTITGEFIGLLIGGIVTFLYQFRWSGFENKKLWDWIELLILPILVAIGSIFLTNEIENRKEKQAEIGKQRETLKLYYQKVKAYTEKKEMQELLQSIKDFETIKNHIPEKRKNENSSQLIIEKSKKLSKLIIEINEKLKVAKPNLETIESLTLADLEELDSNYKSKAVRYLYNLGLIKLVIPISKNSLPSENSQCIRPSDRVEDNYVYTSAIYLKNANLNEIKLSGLDLKYINFCRVKLIGADFSESDISHANINEADLSQANLNQAILKKVESDFVYKIEPKYILPIIVQTDPKVLASETSSNVLGLASEVESLLNGNKILINGQLFSKDLSNANLQGLDLSDTDLSRFNLENSNLSDANLTRTNLSKANLKGVKIDRVNLQNVEGLQFANGLSEKIQIILKLNNKEISLKRDLRSKDLSNMNLDNRDLTYADLTEANLKGASMKQTILRGANLRKTNLEEAKLNNADLSRAKLIKTNLQKAILTNTHLDNAKLIAANLQNANLEGARLHGVEANSTNFNGAKMTGAKLNSMEEMPRTILNSCSMSGVNLSGANLTKTDLISVDLTNSNLQNIEIKGGSFIMTTLAFSNLKETNLNADIKFENTKYFETEFPNNFNPKKTEGLVESTPESLNSNF